MYFNVSQLLKENIGATRTYEISEVFSPVYEAQRCRIVGKVKLLRTDKGIWVSASLDSDVICACSRCLDEFEQPVHMAIDEEYLPVVDVASGARLYYSDEIEDSFFIDHNHVLDMGEAVRQYFSLSFPMKPVCSEDCQGICMTCGGDLNDTACVCDGEQRDVRWDALLELVSINDSDD